jgi:phosphoglycolate phosphatase-like HAD superfamily hydrolase
MNKPHLPKPTGIFFDWDGTLVDSFSFLEAGHNHVLAQYGMPLFEKGGFTEYFGKPRDYIYPAIYGERAADAREKFGAFVVENHRTLLKVMPDAELLLQTIVDMGIVCGVASNKAPEFVNAEIDHFGLRKYFSSVVGAREASEDKPSSAPLFLVMERAGLSAPMETVWYVGDTENDQLCANNAGAQFIYIEHGDVIVGCDEKEKIALRVKNCRELSDFLLQYT